MGAAGGIESESRRARIDAALSGRRAVGGQFVPRGEGSAPRLAAGQQHGCNRRSLGNTMRQVNRLIDKVRSARLQHAMVVLFMLLVFAYGAIALPAIWRGSEKNPRPHGGDDRGRSADRRR